MGLLINLRRTMDARTMVPVVLLMETVWLLSVPPVSERAPQIGMKIRVTRSNTQNKGRYELLLTLRDLSTPSSFLYNRSLESGVAGSESFGLLLRGAYSPCRLNSLCSINHSQQQLRIFALSKTFKAPIPAKRPHQLWLGARTTRLAGDMKEYYAHDPHQLESSHSLAGC